MVSATGAAAGVTGAGQRVGTVIAGRGCSGGGGCGRGCSGGGGCGRGCQPQQPPVTED